jgi:hypothetical protein
VPWDGNSSFASEQDAAEIAGLPETKAAFEVVQPPRR